jgi:hypothetical protein
MPITHIITILDVDDPTVETPVGTVTDAEWPEERRNEVLCTMVRATSLPAVTLRARLRIRDVDPTQPNGHRHGDAEPAP